MNHNFKLFFYGLLANIIIMVGYSIVMLGFCLGGYYLNFYVFFGCIGLGGLIMIYGNSLKFDYKRKSGYIIYNQ